MEQKIPIKRGTIQETLLLPLWGRAFETQKNNPRLVDHKAVGDIVKCCGSHLSGGVDRWGLSEQGLL
jgi:O-methyltransferase involved in polyketide biosynthesis